VGLEKLLGTRKVDGAQLSALLPELGNVSGQTYAQLLKRPEVSLESLLPLLREAMAEAGIVPGGTVNARNERKAVETEIKFAGYLDQQRKAIEKLKKAEQRTIPAGFEYAGMSGLSREMQETLSRVRPQTLGQASRIPGVTPAAVSLLHVHLEVAERRKVAAGG
jgi:tRNA uridine 5-carboxymethylaminomethyl modification enzyme